MSGEEPTGAKLLGAWGIVSACCVLPLILLILVAGHLLSKEPRSLEESDIIVSEMRTTRMTALFVLALGTVALFLAWVRRQAPKALRWVLAAVYLSGWTLAAFARIGDLPAPEPKFDFTEEGVRHFVHYAVQEGLKKDGPDSKLVGDLVSPDHFVHKCYICWGVSEAFNEYAMKGRSSGSFPAEIERNLRSPERKTRLGALEKLVQRYVAVALERSIMTDEEKTKMRAALEEQKKRSKSLLSGFNSDFCPSCNGATRSGK